ncbi:hypothetical protein TNIN_484091 [Trichonephila inaurata madagascariensis]|uniref:Uncharacterized protein n=1 Tax=Trichonephila inaurata madagascariensis TaxID=2747483 RepID=A0A8X6M7I2_9ARAC|nr:hypothetical protein TNIN_484091 [Trichonephila inaurata madagascariensis]
MLLFRACEMIRGCFPFLFPKNVFNLTTDVRKCWTASAQQLRPSDPHWAPNFAGENTSRKVSFYPPPNRQMVAFQHFARLYVSRPNASGGVEDVRGHSETLNPFSERKGCEPRRSVRRS